MMMCTYEQGRVLVPKCLLHNRSVNTREKVSIRRVRAHSLAPAATQWYLEHRLDEQLLAQRLEAARRVHRVPLLADEVEARLLELWGAVQFLNERATNTRRKQTHTPRAHNRTKAHTRKRRPATERTPHQSPVQPLLSPPLVSLLRHTHCQAHSLHCTVADTSHNTQSVLR